MCVCVCVCVCVYTKVYIYESASDEGHAYAESGTQMAVRRSARTHRAERVQALVA